jgi:hypothetical protein
VPISYSARTLRRRRKHRSLARSHETAPISHQASTRVRFQPWLVRRQRGHTWRLAFVVGGKMDEASRGGRPPSHSCPGVRLSLKAQFFWGRSGCRCPGSIFRPCRKNGVRPTSAAAFYWTRWGCRRIKVPRSPQVGAAVKPRFAAHPLEGVPELAVSRRGALQFARVRPRAGPARFGPSQSALGRGGKPASSRSAPTCCRRCSTPALTACSSSSLHEM